MRIGYQGEKLTHGAMMILAPGMGNCFPSIEEGTCASQASSSLERVDAGEEYHEPAWLATRVVILGAGVSALYWVCDGVGNICECI